MKKEALDNLKVKLAEWAGFEKGKGRKVFRKEGGTLFTETNTWWLTPIVGDYRGEYEYLPDFPESLDACEKWLLSKICYACVIFNWGIDDDWKPYKQCEIRCLGDSFFGKEDTNALAFCLAVEELIDSLVVKEEEK